MSAIKRRVFVLHSAPAFKFGELPFHLVRSRRFKDLYENVLFNYEWLHAKLSSCPLQAVLADFEDASNNNDDKDSRRELMLVADALRLGGAILAAYPNMLAPQLIGRVGGRGNHGDSFCCTFSSFRQAKIRSLDFALFVAV